MNFIEFINEVTPIDKVKVPVLIDKEVIKTSYEIALERLEKSPLKVFYETKTTDKSNSRNSN